MRNEIVHIGAGELNYEIRNIMKVVEKVKALGVSVNLENTLRPVRLTLRAQASSRGKTRKKRGMRAFARPVE